MSVGWSDLNEMGVFHQQKYAHAKDEIGEVRNSSLKYISYWKYLRSSDIKCIVSWFSFIGSERKLKLIYISLINILLWSPT